jgi:hypothetical protein
MASCLHRLNVADLEVAVLRSCQEEQDAGNGSCGVCVECLRKQLAEKTAEVERLCQLLEPCRPDTDAQTDDAYPKTVNDVLSLLSAYIADFLPDDVCPGDEYFGAWERQARKVIAPMMQRLESSQELLQEAVEIWDSGDTYEVVWDEWIERARAVGGVK